MIDLSRRPTHLDRFDLSRCSQAEMQPGIAGRLIAAPADALGHAAPPAAVNRDPRPHGIAVRSGTLQAEPDEMARRTLRGCPGSVVQVNEWLILIEHDRVETPVVIQVADRQTPTEVQRPEGLAGPSETSVKRPPGPPIKSCNGIVSGIRGRPSRT